LETTEAAAAAGGDDSMSLTAGVSGFGVEGGDTSEDVDKIPWLGGDDGRTLCDWDRGEDDSDRLKVGELGEGNSDGE
jgi:hypothetical protein